MLVSMRTRLACGFCSWMEFTSRSEIVLLTVFRWTFVFDMETEQHCLL